jgi:3-dehydroquinate synthase II
MLLFKVKVNLKENQVVAFHFIIQNAETVRIVRDNLESVSCVKLKPGEKVLVHVGPGATHFGTSIKETIIEK